MRETRVRSLGRVDPLEKDMATPLQYSCLENPMDGEAWWAIYIVHGVTESRTQLSDFNIHIYIYNIYIYSGWFTHGQGRVFTICGSSSLMYKSVVKAPVSLNSSIYLQTYDYFCVCLYYFCVCLYFFLVVFFFPNKCSLFVLFFFDTI